MLNWITESDQWKANGKEFQRDVLEKALMESNLSTIGFKGDYRFEQDTGMNTGGFTPITFDQMIKLENGYFIKHTAAFFKSNDKENPIKVVRFHWKTPTGEAPSDRVVRIKIEQPLIDLATFVTLAMIASLVTLILMIFIVCLSMFKKQPSTQTMAFDQPKIVILGSFLLLAQAFLLPMTSEHRLQLHCSSMIVLITLGLSTTFVGIWITLEIASLMRLKIVNQEKQTKKMPNRFSFTTKPSTTTTTNTQSTSLSMPSPMVLAKPKTNVGYKIPEKQRKMFKVILVMWIFIQMTLAVAWVLLFPTNLKSIDKQNQQSSNNPSIFHVKFVRYCQLDIENYGSLTFLGLILALNICILLRSVFLAIRLGKNKFSQMDQQIVNLYRIVFYFEMVILAATILLGLIISSNKNLQEHLLLLVSITSLVVSIINTIFLIGGKIKVLNTKSLQTSSTFNNLTNN